MNSFFIVSFLVGVGIGFLLALLLLRPRYISLQKDLETYKNENENLIKLQAQNKDLELQIATLEAQKQVQQEKILWITAAQDTLKTMFQSLALQVLESNSKNILEQATYQFHTLFESMKADWNLKKQEFKEIVLPIEKSLQALDQQIKNLESKREGAYSSLSTHLTHLSEAYKELHESAIKLEQSLKSPLVRGSWGEYQLQRLVEMAGMKEHVSYIPQPPDADKRADMIIYIPGDRKIYVDAKTPMGAYLEAMTADNEATRKTKLKEHLAAVKERIRELGKKEYGQNQTDAFEYVIMFLPNEGLLSVSFEADPEIFQYALERKVLLASPINFLALLKAIALGWQQQQTTEEVEKIAYEIKELYSSFVELMELLNRLRKALGSSMEAFNKIATLCQGKIIPSTKKIKTSGAFSEEVGDVPEIESTLKDIPSQ
jgi:DNA recombination protein RmuC